VTVLAPRRGAVANGVVLNNWPVRFVVQDCSTYPAMSPATACSHVATCSHEFPGSPPENRIGEPTGILLTTGDYVTTRGASRLTHVWGPRANRPLSPDASTRLIPDIYPHQHIRTHRRASEPNRGAFCGMALSGGSLEWRATSWKATGYPPGAGQCAPENASQACGITMVSAARPQAKPKCVTVKARMNTRSYTTFGAWWVKSDPCLAACHTEA
jgi:hypothetical protein